MKVQERIITPEIAKTMLSTNKENRKLSKSTVALYAREMTLGNWQLTPQGLSFDEDGKLIDGQHRLSAVILSGTSQEFIIFSGVPKSTFKVLDTGKKRSSGDMLSILSVKNSTNVSATINKYLSLINSDEKSPTIKVSNTLVLEIYNKYSNIIDELVNDSNFLYRKLKIINLSEMASIMMYLNINKGHNRKYIYSFFEQLITGKDISNQTIEVLRYKLINNAVSVTKFTNKARLSFIKKTWNCYVKKENLKKLYVENNNENNLNFI